MSSEAQNVITRLKNSGLWRTQGLIGGKWSEAYDGKVIEVWFSYHCLFVCLFKVLDENCAHIFLNFFKRNPWL